MHVRFLPQVPCMRSSPPHVCPSALAQTTQQPQKSPVVPALHSLSWSGGQRGHVEGQPVVAEEGCSKVAVASRPTNSTKRCSISLFYLYCNVLDQNKCFSCCGGVFYTREVNASPSGFCAFHCWPAIYA